MILVERARALGVEISRLPHFIEHAQRLQVSAVESIFAADHPTVYAKKRMAPRLDLRHCLTTTMMTMMPTMVMTTTTTTTMTMTMTHQQQVRRRCTPATAPVVVRRF